MELFNFLFKFCLQKITWQSGKARRTLRREQTISTKSPIPNEENLLNAQILAGIPSKPGRPG